MDHFMLLIIGSLCQEECQQQQGVEEATETTPWSNMGREYEVENQKEEEHTLKRKEWRVIADVIHDSYK